MNEMPELVLGNELETGTRKIADTVPESSTAESTLTLDSLSPEEQTAVTNFAGKIDISDRNVVMQYGAAAQNKIARFSDGILQNVQTKDLGEAGKSLSSLVVEIKNFDASSTGDEKKAGLAGLFKKSGGITKQISKLVAGYSKAEVNIEKITSALESHKRTLLKDISMLDALYENNYSYFKEITMYIIAGEKRLKEFREKDIPAQRELAAASGDEMQAQKLNDMTNLAERFEKKLHDLKLTRMISIQMAPQIRLMQNNDALLAEKIQSSITNAIPLWKNQMVIALGLANSQAALATQKKVTDMTNELLVKNSEMLKQGTLEVAKASEESIVSIETVRKSNENLISTINEVLEIQKRGSESRNTAEQELIKLEGDLKSALYDASVRNA